MYWFVVGHGGRSCDERNVVAFRDTVVRQSYSLRMCYQTEANAAKIVYTKAERGK